MTAWRSIPENLVALQLSQNAGLVPSLSIQDLALSPVAGSKVPKELEVLARIRIMDESVDQLVQYHNDGRLAGHEAATVSSMPTFFQSRQSAHPLVAALALCAM